MTGALDVRFERFGPLIGREAELAAIRDRLSEARLVTLTGPGGVGKTRLALEIASQRGAVFVDLSAISDARLVALEVASAVGALPLPDRSPEAWIAAAIGEHPTVLVLDNVEQIADGASAIGRIMVAAPNARILATGLMALGLPGEVHVPIAPLELPSSDRPEDVVSSAAGRLFLWLARAAGRAEELDPESARAIAGLCRRLDGLPLALELAAARLRVLSPDGILRRLESGFTEILSQKRGFPRHSSLDAVLHWTIGLLSEEEQQVLFATSVCAGGFDLPLAEALLPNVEVLPALDELVARGLVTVARDETREPRFTMLETIRAAARSRLSPVDGAVLQRRHGEYIRELVAQFGNSLSGPGDADIGRIDHDRDNLRAAIDWAETNDPDLGLEIAARCLDYWRHYGTFSEGIRRLRSLLAAAVASSPRRPHAMVTLADLQVEADGAALAAATAQEALASAMAAGDLTAEARGRNVLAWVEMQLGHHQAAADNIGRLLQIAAELREPWWGMRAQLLLGIDAAMRDDLDGAIAALTTGADAARAASIPTQEAIQLGDLAELYLGAGRPGEGLQSAARAAALIRDTDGTSYLPWILGSLAVAQTRLGQADEARATLREAVRLVRQSPARGVHGDPLPAALCVLVALGEPELGCRVFGAAEAVHQARGEPLTPAEKRSSEIDLQRARESLDPVKFELAIRAGREAGAEAMLAEVEAFLDDEVSQPEATRRIRLRHGELSEREIEVLTLLGEGRSDGEIAETLYISPKTASVHVSNVKAKLGVATRLEAALKARELGLAKGDV